MEVFAVSFLVFAAVAGLLVFGQWVAGRRMPVGCRPESGVCCQAGEAGNGLSDAFGNPIGPEGAPHGRVEVWCPESGCATGCKRG